jgi:hypothetical protein
MRLHGTDTFTKDETDSFARRGAPLPTVADRSGERYTGVCVCVCNVFLSFKGARVTMRELWREGGKVERENSALASRVTSANKK